MDSMPSVDGILFVLPDLYLSFSTLADFVLVGHRSGDAKFWITAGLHSPRLGETRLHSPAAAMTEYTLLLRSFKLSNVSTIQICMARRCESMMSTQHFITSEARNKYRDWVAEATMVYHSYMLATLKNTVLYT